MHVCACRDVCVCAHVRPALVLLVHVYDARINGMHPNNCQLFEIAAKALWTSPFAHRGRRTFLKGAVGLDTLLSTDYLPGSSFMEGEFDLHWMFLLLTISCDVLCDVMHTLSVHASYVHVLWFHRMHVPLAPPRCCGLLWTPSFFYACS